MGWAVANDLYGFIAGLDWREAFARGIAIGLAAGLLAVVLSVWSFYRTHTTRQKVKLKTVAARFGYFIHKCCTVVALAIALAGVFLTYQTSSSGDSWIFLVIAGVLALLIWLIGRGLFFVFAGTLDDAPSQSERTSASGPRDTR